MRALPSVGSIVLHPLNLSRPYSTPETGTVTPILGGRYAAWLAGSWSPEQGLNPSQGSESLGSEPLGHQGTPYHPQLTDEKKETAREIK